VSVIRRDVRANQDRPVTSSSFDAFFTAAFPRTVRLAHLLTGSDAAAEDLAQDAFARVHPKFDDLDNPDGYLHVVTVNVCRQWHRQRFRRERVLRLVHPVDDVNEAVYERMLVLVDALPYRQRAVLVLRYWLGLSETEFAIAVRCRPGTVRSLHFRALAALRTDLP